MENHLHGSTLLKVDKFATLATLNYRNFVVGSNSTLRICSGMSIIEGYMILKDHSRFKFVHESQLHGLVKDKVFENLLGSGINQVKHL